MEIPAPTPLAARPTLAFGCIGACFPAGLLDEACGLGFAPIVLHHFTGEMGSSDEGPREMLAATRQALGKSRCPTEWGAGAVVTSTEEAAAFATAGFTWFTFDVTAVTDDRTASMSLDQLDAAVVAAEDFGCYRHGWHESYLDREWRTASGRILTFTDDVLARAAVKFGPALAHADQLQQAIRTLWVGHGQAPDLELSLAGTRTPTSLDEFLFLTLESARRGLNPVSIAPSLGAAWQPGADFPGEPGEMETYFAALGEIAALAGSQKVGIHHAAGKTGIMPLARRVLGDRSHLNCEEATWLEALGRLADSEPQVFREWLRQAQEIFPFATGNAALSINEEDIRSLPDAPNGALRDTFLGHVNGRQLLLATFPALMRQQRSLRDAVQRAASASH
jgi:hypothetical protein